MEVVPLLQIKQGLIKWESNIWSAYIYFCNLPLEALVLAPSVRVSRFMFTEQASAQTESCSEAGAVLEADEEDVETLAEVLWGFKHPDCPSGCDMFSDTFLNFPFSQVAEGFKILFLVLSWEEQTFFSGLQVLVWRTVRGCRFSEATLAAFGCDNLKGTSLVHSFFDLAFSCSKKTNWWRQR